MRDIGRRKTSNIRKEITVRNIIFLNKYLVYRKECFDARSFCRVCSTYLTPHNLVINRIYLLFLRFAEYWWRVFCRRLFVFGDDIDIDIDIDNDNDGDDDDDNLSMKNTEIKMKRQ